MNEEIYREHILDRYSRPRNKGALSQRDIELSGSNPNCGDALKIFISFNPDGTVATGSFEGTGCAISQAAADLLMDAIRGKSIAELRLLTPGEIYTMLGIEVSPARSKCALLAYGALQELFKHEMR